MPLVDLSRLHLKALIKPYQVQVNLLIERELDALGSPSQVKEACKYALQSDGKRFRPAITLMIANQLKAKQDVGLAALSIEFFHTASLIADDLPMMDDDAVRRSKPATHIEYGSDVALLSSYALIGAGYQAIFKLKEKLFGQLPELDKRCFIALELLAKNNGLDGAPLGQWLDLSITSPTQSELEDLFYRKTILFFETAFVFGWLFSGADLSGIERIKKGAFHFGMAFQIYDDFCDLEEDRDKGKAVNYPLELGIDKSKADFSYHLKKSAETLKEISAFPVEFKELFSFLEKKVLLA